MRLPGLPDKLRIAVKGDDMHVLWPGDLAQPYKRSGYEVHDYPASTRQPVPGNSGGVGEAEALAKRLCAEGSRVGPWEELPEVSRDAWRRKAREQLEEKCSVCGGLLEGAPAPECDSVGCPGRQGD